MGVGDVSVGLQAFGRHPGSEAGYEAPSEGWLFCLCHLVCSFDPRRVARANTDGRIMKMTRCSTIALSLAAALGDRSSSPFPRPPIEAGSVASRRCGRSAR